MSTGYIENSEACVMLTFESVQKDKLDLVKDKLNEVLNEILQSPDKFDMKRMQVRRDLMPLELLTLFNIFRI